MTVAARVTTNISIVTIITITFCASSTDSFKIVFIVMNCDLSDKDCVHFLVACSLMGININNITVTRLIRMVEW